MELTFEQFLTHFHYLKKKDLGTPQRATHLILSSQHPGLPLILQEQYTQTHSLR